MSFYEPAPLRTPLTPVDPDRVVRLGMGVAAAPLWATYFTAASAGMAFWWMTAWTRREPTAFAPALRALAPEPAPAAPEIPAREAAPEAAPIEAAVEAVVEAAVEAVLAPTAPEPTIESEPAPSAIAEPTVEAAPATKAAAETMTAAAPVAAGLEPPVEPIQTAAAVAKAASKEPAAPKPPVKRRPEPKKP